LITDFTKRLTEVISIVGNKEKLATAAGVSAVMIGKYERGGSLPAIDKAMSIANAAGVNVAWLITGEGPMRKGQGGGKAVHNSSGVMQFDSISGGVRMGDLHQGATAPAAPGGAQPQLGDDLREFIELFHRYGNPAVLKTFIDKLLKLKEISEG